MKILGNFFFHIQILLINILKPTLNFQIKNSNEVIYKFNSTNWLKEYIKSVNITLFQYFDNYITLNKSNENYTKCENSILYQKKIEESPFWDIFKYSAHNFPDQGLEGGCLRLNYSFFLFIIQYDSKFISPENYTGSAFLLPFLSYSQSFYGLCINPNCNDLVFYYANYLNDSIKKKDNKSIVGFSFFFKKNTTSNNYNLKENNSFLIFCFLIIFILLFRLIVTCFDFFYFTSEKKKDKDYIINSAETSFDSEYELSYSTIKIDNNMIFENEKKKRKNDNEEENKNVCLNNFFKCFSFLFGVKCIFTRKNIYFSEKGIRLICFFRVLALFLICLNHNLWTTINLPTKELNNLLFFNSPYLFCLKYSTYGNFFFIILDGITFAYKFMYYLKKNCIKRDDKKISFNFTFGKFIKFYIKIIPNIITFFFIFFAFHYFIKFSLYFDFPTMYHHIIDNIITCRECVKDLKFFFKLKFLYSDYFFYNNFKSSGFKYCFKFVSVMVNEFICFTLILIIVSFSLLIQKKCFDIIILILLIINSILSPFQCFIETGKYYTFEHLMNSSCTLKYTHLFLNHYLFGFFTGMSLFYYKDLTNKNSLEALKLFKPFNFCYKIIAFLDKRKNCTKKFLFYFCVFIQIICSAPYFLYIKFPKFFLDEGLYKNFYFKINNTVKYIDTFTKPVVIIAFAFMLIFIYLYPKETFFKQVYSSNITIPIYRVGIAYFCDSDIIIYIFCATYRPEVHLTFLNISIVTLGLILFIAIINIIICAIIEMPIRIIMKKIFDSNNSENKYLILN